MNIGGCKTEKQITYKGKSIKITADFSTETLKARRAWSEVFWTLNENNFNPRILYPAKLSFKIDGAIEVFHDKQKLKQYMTTKQPLQKILQEILHIENESKQNHKKAGSTKPQDKKRQRIREQHELSSTHQTLKQQKQISDRNHHILPQSSCSRGSYSGLGCLSGE
jgi:vacuolar-type H+-ATPase catalytic subunit A/Vma1